MRDELISFFKSDYFIILVFAILILGGFLLSSSNSNNPKISGMKYIAMLNPITNQCEFILINNSPKTYEMKCGKAYLRGGIFVYSSDGEYEVGNLEYFCFFDSEKIGSLRCFKKFGNDFHEIAENHNPTKKEGKNE